MAKATDIFKKRCGKECEEIMGKMRAVAKVVAAAAVRVHERNFLVESESLQLFFQKVNPSEQDRSTVLKVIDGLVPALASIGLGQLPTLAAAELEPLTAYTRDMAEFLKAARSWCACRVFDLEGDYAQKLLEHACSLRLDSPRWSELITLIRVQVMVTALNSTVKVIPAKLQMWMQVVCAGEIDIALRPIDGYSETSEEHAKAKRAMGKCLTLWNVLAQRPAYVVASSPMTLPDVALTTVPSTNVSLLA